MIRVRAWVPLLLGLLLFAAAGPASGSARHEVPVAADTEWETTAYVRDSGVPGPTVWIVGGVHGNEPAGWRAARIVREWPIRAGRMVVLPRANARGLAEAVRRVPAPVPYDLNRRFPSAKAEPVSDVLAGSIWELLEEYRPDWLLDLHESKDYRYRTTESRKTLGNTVIVHPDPAAEAIAKRMARAADAHVIGERYRWQVLHGPIEGSLARAAATRLGSKAAIVETCRKTYLGVRVAQHRLVVHRLLAELGMLPEDFSPETPFPSDRADGEIRVGIYNSTGTGMNSAWQIERCLTGDPHVACRRLTAAAIRGGALDALDVVAFPGGTGHGTADALAGDGRERVRRFVAEGGGFLGICAGAYLATAHYSWSLGILDAKVLDSAHWNRGQADLRIALTPAGRRFFGRGEAKAVIRYNQGPILAPGGDPDLPDYETLAVYATEVAKKGAPTGVMIGTPALVRGSFGEGRVAAFGPHPESSKDTSLRTLVLRTARWLAGGD